MAKTEIMAIQPVIFPENMHQFGIADYDVLLKIPAIQHKRPEKQTNKQTIIHPIRLE